LGIDLVLVLFVVVLVVVDLFDCLYLPTSTFAHHQPLHLEFALGMS
jgi:hypothetical protein